MIGSNNNSSSDNDNDIDDDSMTNTPVECHWLFYCILFARRRCKLTQLKQRQVKAEREFYKLFQLRTRSSLSLLVTHGLRAPETIESMQHTSE